MNELIRAKKVVDCCAHLGAAAVIAVRGGKEEANSARLRCIGHLATIARLLDIPLRIDRKKMAQTQEART